MFGIGLTEFILIAVVILLVFGPEKIPVVARTVAKLYREIRTTGQDFTDVFRQEMGDIDVDLKGLGKGIFDDDSPAAGKAKQNTTQRSAEAPRQKTPADWLETEEEDFGHG